MESIPHASPAVRKATTLLYQASLAIYMKHGADLMQYWTTSPDPFPVLYRCLSTVQWPILKRADGISSKGSPARGCCFGLSRGNSPNPYCHAPEKYHALIHQIITSAARDHPLFRFTTIQINVDLSAALHADCANIGPSLVLAIGPHTGGNLWVFNSAEGTTIDLSKWSLTNGRLPHTSLPHAGKRMSIVLFTHAATMSNNASSAIAETAVAGSQCHHRSLHKFLRCMTLHTSTKAYNQQQTLSG